MNVKPLLLIISLASLSACAQTPGRPIASPANEKVESRPASALTEDVLYQFLLGEIAGQRGDLALAKEAYADLAKKTRDSRVARRASEWATFADDAGQAVEMARLWVELEPDSLKGRQHLAGLLIRNDRLAEARPHIEAVFRLDGRPPAEVFQQLHGLLARAKDKMAALALLKELASAYPGVPEAQLAVAQGALAAGQDIQARLALDEALRLRPGWEPAALAMGQALSRGDGREAIEFWSGFVVQYPEAERVALAYAKALTRAARYDEAGKLFETMIVRNPDNPDLLFAAGLVSMQMNDLASAEAYLSSALAKGYPDEGLVRGYLGQIGEGRGQHEQALAWYLGVEPGQHYFQARLKAAVVLGKLGRLDEGRELLAKLETSSQTEKALAVQADAQLLRDAKRFQEAYDVLGKALDGQPDSGNLLYDRAMIAEKLNRLDQVERDLRRLIELEPEHAHAYNALGYTLIDRTNRLDEGVALLEQALKLSPNDPFILDSMGWAQYKAGRLDRAAEYLRDAYGRKDDPEIAAHLGEALWAAGRRDEARTIWRESLNRFPDNDLLKETVSRFDK